MIKKSLALSAIIHLLLGGIIFFLFFHKEVSKRKVVPLHIVKLAMLPNLESEQKPKPVLKPKPEPKVKPKLQSKPKSEPKVKPKLQSKPKPEPKVKPKLQSKPNPKPKQSFKVKPISKPKTDKKQKLSSVVMTDIRNRYLSYVYSKIDEHKKYPRIAKRLAQSGIVKITFTILADGLIVNISLSKSSGFSRLDKAAQEILQHLIHVNPIPKELGQKSLTITIPVNYTIR